MQPTRVALMTIMSIVMASAAAQFGRTAARPSFDDLIQTIRTGNAYQRAQSVRSLYWIDDPRVVPELIALLGDEDAEVRARASHQLARRADKRAADALAGALTDSNSSVRQFAADGLAQIGDERHVPALVASVMAHPPGPKATVYETLACSASLTAIGALSSKAPPELISLTTRLIDDQNGKDDDQWRVLADMARCLGQIGDEAAREPLVQAREVLETDRQDYHAWHAVRKALAAIIPQDAPFSNAAAEILDSAGTGKMSPQELREQWVQRQRLVRLGEKAVDDLAWALRFESERDRHRVRMAVEALGDIGGARATDVLRQYIEQQLRMPEKERRRRQLPMQESLLALLKADPNEATVRQVIRWCGQIGTSERGHLVRVMSLAPAQNIPPEVKISFCRALLLDRSDAVPLDEGEGRAAIDLLGQIGGPQAGEILGTVLLTSLDWEQRRAAQAWSALRERMGGPQTGEIPSTIRLTSPTWEQRRAAQALSTIRGFDAVPTLTAAAATKSIAAEILARALGTIADPRAIPVLKEMAGRDGLSEQDRLWIAAALARLDVDYAENARMIRESLPDALSQACWLHDRESTLAVASFLDGDRNAMGRALKVLEAIAGDMALKALTDRIEPETATDFARLQTFSATAARVAKRLGHPDSERWDDIATTVTVVRGWFTRPQQQLVSRQESERLHMVVTRNPDLARRVWIVEANRHLDLKANGPRSPLDALIRDGVGPARAIYGPDLVPTLERICRESTTVTDFPGKTCFVKFFLDRSEAAQLLTEKTGKVYTFVDVDGRTHPGGWDPSQE